MSLASNLYTALTQASITAIFSDRIYPIIGMQGASYPYMVYIIDSIEPHDTKQGVSDLDEYEVTIAIAANDSYLNLETAANTVREAIDRYSGNNIQSIQFLDEDSDWDDKAECYICEQTYKIRFIN